MSDEEWAYNEDDSQVNFQDYIEDDDGLDSYLDEYVPEKAKTVKKKDESDDDDIDEDEDIEIDEEVDLDDDEE